MLNTPLSSKTFSMIKMSTNTTAQQSLATIKKELFDDQQQQLLNLSSQDLFNATHILSEVGVDPTLLYQLPQLTLNAVTLAVIRPIIMPSVTPHPCTVTHDGVMSDSLSPPCSPLPLPPPSSDFDGVVSLPVTSLLLPNVKLYQISPGIKSIESSPHFTPSTPHTNANIDPLFDPDSQDQKVVIIQVASNATVDHKGKSVDRSSASPQIHNCLGPPPS